MWLVIALLAANSAAPLTAGVDRVAAPAKGPAIGTRFDLSTPRRNAGYRLDRLEAVAADDQHHPLAVTPIEDGRQRLRIGIGGSGAAKLGIAYNLILGR